MGSNIPSCIEFKKLRTWVSITMGLVKEIGKKLQPDKEDGHLNF